MSVLSCQYFWLRFTGLNNHPKRERERETTTTKIKINDVSVQISMSVDLKKVKGITDCIDDDDDEMM